MDPLSRRCLKLANIDIFSEQTNKCTLSQLRVAYCIKRHTKCQATTSSVMSQSFKAVDMMISLLLAKNHWENVLMRTVSLQWHNVPYFLEYSPGLKLNLGQFTHRNWKVLSLFKSGFEPEWLWTIQLIKPRGLIEDLRYCTNYILCFLEFIMPSNSTICIHVLCRDAYKWWWR